MILAELGGKGNPRIMRYIRMRWDRIASGTSEYIVTLWSYPVTVRTRAEAAQLLHAISHVTRR